MRTTLFGLLVVLGAGAQAADCSLGVSHGDLAKVSDRAKVLASYPADTWSMHQKISYLSKDVRSKGYTHAIQVAQDSKKKHIQRMLDDAKRFQQTIKGASCYGVINLRQEMIVDQGDIYVNTSADLIAAAK